MGISIMSMHGRIGLGTGWVTFPPIRKERKTDDKEKRFRKEREVEGFLVMA